MLIAKLAAMVGKIGDTSQLSAMTSSRRGPATELKYFYQRAIPLR